MCSVTHNIKKTNYNVITVADFTFAMDKFTLFEAYSFDPLIKEEISDLEERQLEELINTNEQAHIKHMAWRELNKEYLKNNRTRKLFKVQKRIAVKDRHIISKTHGPVDRLKSHLEYPETAHTTKVFINNRGEDDTSKVDSQKVHHYKTSSSIPNHEDVSYLFGDDLGLKEDNIKSITQQRINKSSFSNQ